MIFFLEPSRFNSEIVKLINKFPNRFWTIFWGCYEKPTSLTEITKKYGFAKRSLYQHGIAKDMVRLGILKRIPSKNKKFKLYKSQFDWFK